MLAWESLHSISVGGAAVVVTELSAAMERHGHEVHVFTRMAPGQRYHSLIDGVRYHRCPYPAHHDFVDDVNNMCRAIVDRFFAVEDMVGNFDIVHAHDWLAANAMIWIKQGRGPKCVFTIHSTEYARCGNTFPGGQSARVRDQERAGTYWADKVMCVSNATKNEAMWMYEVPDWKASVVYNGVSSDRFNKDVDVESVKQAYGIHPMEPTVLFCGRLEWQKGPDLLVEAIPLVLRGRPNAKFVFAGDGGMRPELERRAWQIGAGDAVRFVGFQDGDSLVELFRMSDVVCVPSRNEPFGIVILEAWSAGKPVVATDVGGPNEFVQPDFDGLKIAPHPNSIAWGLGALMSDFEKARWMGRNGRRTVIERFSWDVIAAHALGVYGLTPKPLSEEIGDIEKKDDVKVPCPPGRPRRRRTGVVMGTVTVDGARALEKEAAQG
jgi:glycosyltransferase involved in cell wall biosynthesis